MQSSHDGGTHHAAWSRYSLTRTGSLLPNVRFSDSGCVGPWGCAGGREAQSGACGLQVGRPADQVVCLGGGGQRGDTTPGADANHPQAQGRWNEPTRQTEAGGQESFHWP
jgi:hypothetical protein